LMLPILGKFNGMLWTGAVGRLTGMSLGHYLQCFCDSWEGHGG